MDIQLSTDQPSNIRWENIPYSSGKRFCRKLFSVFLALLIIASTFGIVIAAHYIQRDINQSFNSDIDCTYYSGSTDMQVYIEYTDPNITTRNKVLTYCFCINQLYSNGFSNTENVQILGVKPCADWVVLWLQNEGLNIGIIILVPTVNLILAFILSGILY